MILKKICMLGGFSVGKTSLVARFVHSMFSDKYLTTIGVKIDKKTVRVGDSDVNMMLWDIYGEDDFQKVKMSYLKGSSGYLLVVDGTRKATLQMARKLQGAAEETLGKVPFTLVLNKSDLAESWELDEGELGDLQNQGWSIVRTSAKTGAAVEETFLELARRMVSG
jgi:small GTP-binding protein